jgi:hypothetical protein
MFDLSTIQGWGSGLDPESVTLHTDSESGSRIRIQGQENKVKTLLFSTFFQFYYEKVCFASGSALDPDSMTLWIRIPIELKRWILIRIYIESIRIHTPGSYLFIKTFIVAHIRYCTKYWRL